MKTVPANSTPGPWKWVVNPKSYEVDLSRGSYGTSVMRFRRWGMSGASPQFRDGDDRLAAAVEFTSAEAGREHHSTWWRVIAHPDATLIAAAPDLLAVAMETRRRLNDVLSRGVGTDVATVVSWLELVEAAIARAEVPR